MSRNWKNLCYSGMITGYAIAKTGLMNATNEISISRANVLSNPCNWIVPSVSIKHLKKTEKGLINSFTKQKPKSAF